MSSFHRIGMIFCIVLVIHRTAMSLYVCFYILIGDTDKGFPCIKVKLSYQNKSNSKTKSHEKHESQAHIHCFASWGEKRLIYFNVGKKKLHYCI